MVGMLYVLGLVAAFGAFWFVVAALQSFDDAATVRLTNVVAALVCAAVAGGFFWAGRRVGRAQTTAARDPVARAQAAETGDLSV